MSWRSSPFSQRRHTRQDRSLGTASSRLATSGGGAARYSSPSSARGTCLGQQKYLLRPYLLFLDSMAPNEGYRTGAERGSRRMSRAWGWAGDHHFEEGTPFDASQENYGRTPLSGPWAKK